MIQKTGFLKSSVFQKIRGRSLKFYLVMVSGILLLALLVFCLIPFREPLFKVSCSTIIFDREGRLMHCHIAEDEQWRFPGGILPEKYTLALIEYEDRRFYRHLGVRPGSIIRALYQNLQAGEIVSGGSTLTMQVIRLSRQNERTYYQKIIEMLLALRLELHRSKEEILQLYANNAPFGGNIVGLEAAAYGYFGTSPELLSWGESALLAVLPNAPSLMYPGRNNTALKEKRDRLLHHLYQEGYFDSLTLNLALQEEIPQGRYSYPAELPHLLLRAHNEGRRGERIYSTIEYDLQRRAAYQLQKHHLRLSQNKIENAAVLITGTATGEVLAYLGNTEGESDAGHGYLVDNISANRSTGSILKPFLYAAMLDSGQLLPKQLIPDYPLIYNGFSPENYNHIYQGAVPADQALIQSLNVPFVSLLDRFGAPLFHDLLGRLNISLPFPPGHYGLTMIVGGVEISPWDVSGIYSSMARSLLEYTRTGFYQENGYRKPYWVVDEQELYIPTATQSPLSAGAIWLTLNSLYEVNRPDEEAGWTHFSSSRSIAWKTGTSWGFRDSWAVGVTPEYTITVWVGNSSGEGRPGNTGTRAAAPLLFDLADLLPATSVFQPPYSDLEEVEICAESGYLKGQYCEDSEKILVPKNGFLRENCPFHKLIHLDESETYRVDSLFYPVDSMVHKSWFVLPPIEQWYYRYRHSDYLPLPPWHPDWKIEKEENRLRMVYPSFESRVVIPIEIDGSQGKVIFKAAHSSPDEGIYWFLDNQFLGITENYHEMELSPPLGKHRLTLMDSQGESLSRDFFVELP